MSDYRIDIYCEDAFHEGTDPVIAVLVAAAGGPAWDKWRIEGADPVNVTQSLPLPPLVADMDIPGVTQTQRWAITCTAQPACGRGPLVIGPSLGLGGSALAVANAEWREDSVGPRVLPWPWQVNQDRRTDVSAKLIEAYEGGLRRMSLGLLRDQFIAQAPARRRRGRVAGRKGGGSPH
jgi:hypothetical protein